MKNIIIILFLAVLTFSVTTPTTKAGWFGNDDSQKQQIDQLQGQLQQQQQSKGDWQGIACLLGIASVITLVVGAAIGSKARRAAHERRE